MSAPSGPPGLLSVLMSSGVQGAKPVSHGCLAVYPRFLWHKCHLLRSPALAARDTGRQRDTRWCRAGWPELGGWRPVLRAGCPWRGASCTAGTGGWGGRAAENSCRAGSTADAGTSSGSLSPLERRPLLRIERKLLEGLITYPRPGCRNSKLGTNCLSLQSPTAPSPRRGPGEGQPCVPSCPHRRRGTMRAVGFQGTTWGWGSGGGTGAMGS